MLIENLQALPNKELSVMVYNESTAKLEHVVLAEYEDTSEMPSRLYIRPQFVVRLFTDEFDK